MAGWEAALTRPRRAMARLLDMRVALYLRVGGQWRLTAQDVPALVQLREVARSSQVPNAGVPLAEQTWTVKLTWGCLQQAVGLTARPVSGEWKVRVTGSKSPTMRGMVFGVVEVVHAGAPTALTDRLIVTRLTGEAAARSDG
jgi:hypothetical protein